MLRKTPLLVLFSFLSYFAIAQTYLSIDYAPCLTITDQFAASIVSQSRVVFTPNQSSAFIIGRKIKKRNLKIETGVRFTTHNIATIYDDQALAIDEERFPRDILEKFSTIEIPLSIKFDFNFVKKTKVKDKNKEVKESKWSYSGLFGISYTSVFNATIEIDGSPTYFRDFNYHLNGKDYRRLYLFSGGSDGALPTLALNYGVSANYKFRKKSSISLTVAHHSGFVPIVGSSIFIRTYNSQPGFVGTLITLTSNASYLCARLGYFYNF